jgi:ACS family tartrate transporter-like MFS transporter
MFSALQIGQFVKRRAEEIAMWRILPLLAVCMFINIIDRSNISIAAVDMRHDIALSATAYGLGAGLFYIAYFFFEVPSNIMLHRYGARRWIARIMVSWGLAAMLMGFVQGEWSFYTLRFMLGVAEAGFFPGVIYYLSQWFDRRSLTKALGLFTTATLLLGAFGTVITAGLLALVGWRWLFIVEGLPAILMAYVVLRFLPDRIEDAKWLSENEKKDLAARLPFDRTEQPASWKSVASEPQTILLALQYFCIILASQALFFWLPQILHEEGLDPATAGLLSAAPYLISGIATPLWALHSARTDERYWHAILPCIAAGLTLLISAGFSLNVIETVLVISVAMAFICMATAAFWSTPRIYATGAIAAASIAFTNCIGNLAGFAGPYAMGAFKDATGNFSTVMLLFAISLFAAAALAGVTGRMADPTVRDRKLQNIQEEGSI